MDISFIFIGSTHGFIDDFSKQKEIIELEKPDFVLSEELEDLQLDSKEKFDELFKNKIISNMTSFNEVKKLVKLCFEKDIKLIGIDFRNFGFDEVIQRKIKNQEKVSKREEEEISKILKSREEKHLKEILYYQKKTKTPLVIILGCWHLRENSLLRNKLKNYKVILPCDKQGNFLFSPEGNKEDINYKEIISNAPKIKD